MHGSEELGESFYFFDHRVCNLPLLAIVQLDDAVNDVVLVDHRTHQNRFYVFYSFEVVRLRWKLYGLVTLVKVVKVYRALFLGNDTADAQVGGDANHLVHLQHYVSGIHIELAFFNKAIQGNFLFAQDFRALFVYQLFNCVFFLFYLDNVACLLVVICTESYIIELLGGSIFKKAQTVLKG